MAKIKAGITGGFKGHINQVTGYRRLGKNVVTGINPYSSININPDLISNSHKLSSIKNYFSRTQKGIVRELVRLGLPSVVKYDDLMRLNIRHWVNSDVLSDNYLILDQSEQKITTPLVFNYTGINKEPGSSRSRLFKFELYYGQAFVTRTRYYEFSNSLQQLDQQITVNSIGSSTPFGATPIGKYVAQISTVKSNSGEFFSQMAFNCSQRVV